MHDYSIITESNNVRLPLSQKIGTKMLQLKARPKRKILSPRQEKTDSIVVECPKCKAVITLINAQQTTKRYCWRCLEEFSYNIK